MPSVVDEVEVRARPPLRRQPGGRSIHGRQLHRARVGGLQPCTTESKDLRVLGRKLSRTREEVARGIDVVELLPRQLARRKRHDRRVGPIDDRGSTLGQ